MKTLVICYDEKQFRNFLVGKHNPDDFIHAKFAKDIRGSLHFRIMTLSGWKAVKSPSFMRELNRLVRQQQALHRSQRKARKPVNRVSNKRKVENGKYSYLSRKWKADKACSICGNTPVDVHHSRGRIGELLLETAYWIPLCRTHHDFVKTDPEWARSKGLLPPLGQYNSIPKE